MKTLMNYRTTFFSFLVTSLLTSSLLVACDKDDDDINDDDNMYTLSGDATGAKEIPANTSTGTATISGTYNKASNSLSYTINWTGLTGNLAAAHFHGPASATETAGPLVDITIGTNGTSGMASNTVTVTDAFESALLDGKIYYNLHTVQFPNGQVRSQVATSPQ